MPRGLCAALLVLALQPAADGKRQRQKRCAFKTVQASSLLAAPAGAWRDDRPLLIQGADLPPHESRTRAGFREALGTHTCFPVAPAAVAQQSEIGSPPAKGGAATSFGAWVDGLDGVGGGDPSAPYIFHVCSNAPSCDAALARAYGVPQFARHLSQHLFVAAGATAKGLPLHAHEATWAFALSGTKTWFVAPPREPPVQPYTHFSEADYSAVPEMQRCVQREGEIVYLPPAWWHATFAQSNWTLTVCCCATVPTQARWIRWARCLRSWRLNLGSFRCCRC
jgi:hypothetical protein